jgi:nucleotide-binding universal stress UspA family protein
MAEHPVVACYRNSDSASAIHLGTCLATTLHEPLLLVSAYDYEPVALTPGVIPTSFNDVRFDVAQRHVDHARELVPAGVVVREDVVPAEGVAEALATEAREADACALVVGRDVDGHIARALLERSPCPLAVARWAITAPAGEPLRTIGVAWDGSPGARFALQAAMHLAIRAPADVQVISVGSRTDADVAVAQLSQAVTAKAVQLDGDPRRGLVEASAALDLLVCGSHGRGRVFGALLGSVSARLLEAAHCAVMVVPPRVRSRATAPLGLTTAAG